jgi:hypothetical protein
MTTRDPSDENQVRRSRRFKWTVLIGFALLALATGLGVLFIPWDIKPLDTPDLDFKLPAVAPEQNAATYFEAAGKLQVTKFPRDWTELLNHGDNLQGKPFWDPAFADAVLAANAATFAELEKGLACQQHVSAPYSPASDLVPLSAQKRLALLLSLKARRSWLAGHHAEAAQSDLQGWQFARLSTQGNGVLIEWLVGDSFKRIVLAEMEELAADSHTPEPVLRTLLAGLDLETRQVANDGFKQTIKGEYAWIKSQRDNKTAPSWFVQEHPVAGRLDWIPYTNKPNVVLHMYAQYYRIVIDNVDRPWNKTRFDHPWRFRCPDSEFTWYNVKFYACPSSIGALSVFEGTMGLGKAVSRNC